MKGVPFVNVTYMKVVPFPSKKVYISKGKGLDFRVEPPLIKMRSSTPSLPPRPWPHCSKQDEDKPGLPKNLTSNLNANKENSPAGKLFLSKVDV